MIFYTRNGYYIGMDQETVLRLRQELGLETEFITKEQYDQLLGELPK